MPRFVITLTAEQLHFARAMAAAANRSVSNQLASLLIEAMHKNSDVQRSTPQHLTVKPMQENPIVYRSDAEPQQLTSEELRRRGRAAKLAYDAGLPPRGANEDIEAFIQRVSPGA